jgi:hypothetical protein
VGGMYRINALAHNINNTIIHFYISFFPFILGSLKHYAASGERVSEAKKMKSYKVLCVHGQLATSVETGEIIIMTNELHSTNDASKFLIYVQLDFSLALAQQ